MNSYELFMQYLALSGNEATIELVGNDWVIIVLAKYGEELKRVTARHYSLLRAAELVLDSIKVETRLESCKRQKEKTTKGFFK